MPSPIGHALAGVAIAWIAEPPAGTPRSFNVARTPDLKLGPTPTVLVCATLAVLPDIDLLYLPIHRTATHSWTAVALVMIIAAGVTGWVTGKVSWRFVAVCGVAYASHIVMDWLGRDASVPYGIQMFWPFSDRWFISPIRIFPGTERRAPFSTRSILINVRALTAEVAICGSVVAALWVRRTRRSRDPISDPADPRQPFA